jgi:hypothetical protein
MALWTPANLAVQPLIWYDVQNSSSITHSSGAVSQITNLGSGSYNAVQATSLLQPVYSATGFDGSLPSIEFGASGETYLSVGNLSGESYTSIEAFTIEIRALDPPVTDPTSGALLSNFGTEPNNWPDSLPWVDSNVSHAFGSTERKSGWNPSSSIAAARIHNFRSASGAWSHWMDDVVEYTTATNTVGKSSDAQLGSWNQLVGGSPFYWVGKMGEVIILGYTPTTPEREKIIGYLGWRWDMVANIPIGHTYKSAAPTTTGTVNETNSDTITATDTYVGTGSISASLTETLTAADTPVAGFTVAASVSEALAASDTNAGTRLVTDSITETLTAADTNSAGDSVVVTETLTALDGVDAVIRRFTPRADRGGRGIRRAIRTGGRVIR